MMWQGKPWLSPHAYQEDVGIFTYTDKKGKEHKFEIDTGPGDAFGTVVVEKVQQVIAGTQFEMTRKETFRHHNAGIVAQAVLARYKEIHNV